MLEDELIDLAVEGWRFSRVVARALQKLDGGEGDRYVSRLRFFERKLTQSLEAAGFTLVNLEGQPFDPGMAATALNLGDFGPESTLLVDQVLEPVVMGPEGLKRQGTVTVREVTL